MITEWSNNLYSPYLPIELFLLENINGIVGKENDIGLVDFVITRNEVSDDDLIILYNKTKEEEGKK